MVNPLISVCIPAYKRTDFLKRLLDSLLVQSFKNFEVIITDDSPGDDVQKLVKLYASLNIVYFKNSPVLGTPENWNEGIRRAKGKWIKIMHDDDWFTNETSLQQFANAAENNAGDFIFSAYTNVFLDKNYSKQVFPSSARLKALIKNPVSLFSKNIIGPPSVIMHKNNGNIFYDNKTKWVVDIDFYIRRLSGEKINYIDRPLINVGMSSQQVTVDCVFNRKVQLPENFYLLYKVGTHHLKNVLIYDAWWRLFRNLEVRYEKEVREAGYDGPIHPVLLNMIRSQQNIPKGLLKNGVFSKIRMFAHYLKNRSKIS